MPTDTRVNEGEWRFLADTDGAKRELKIPVEKVRVPWDSDTDYTPYDWQTVASRFAVMGGNAVIMAARDVNAKLYGIVARELGIHPNNLYKWRAQFAAEGAEAFPGKGNLSSSDEELHRLRRENMRLREERDILKKAVIFFGNESK